VYFYQDYELSIFVIFVLFFSIFFYSSGGLGHIFIMTFYTTLLFISYLIVKNFHYFQKFAKLSNTEYFEISCVRV